MTFDVAVAGAGPAGCALASRLARAGVRVALIDGSHPREKPCGGGYTGRALALLSALMPDTALPGNEIRAARFLDTPRNKAALLPLDAAHPLVVVSRRVADAALYDAATCAGAVPVHARIVDVTVDTTARVSLADGRSLAATWIVGADGANSLVRRRLSRPFARTELSVATGFYAHGITSNEIVLELVGDPPGYIWSFPRLDHLAIGICAQATDTDVGTLRSRLVQWLEATHLAQGARLESYSWPIPALTPAGFDQLEISGPGWMTLGDAAGLVDPITREGLYFALQSAAFAAEALLASSSSADTCSRYRDRVRADIVDDLRMAATLKAGFFERAFSTLLVDALVASPRIQAVMADLIAGTQPYRTLKRRLVGTCELGLAWRVLQDSRRRSTRSPQVR